MKKACPSDTCPAIPVRMFKPRAAMAKMNIVAIGRNQLPSPRNRTNGIQLMTGRENGIRNMIATTIAATTFLVKVGSICDSVS
jgi:hypothetical protein